MKPKIVLSNLWKRTHCADYKWKCFNPENGQLPQGFGATPTEAYNAWVENKKFVRPTP